ncbi:hypothetical protein B0J14DRAFT_614782 [Halenospora varia]|nr:hypothetical protein B0J14DRAFT_614782 [Halenospora varia]
MGIFDRIRERGSKEEGIRIVTKTTGDSMTSDIEILRGEVAGILFDVTKDDVSYIFGNMVESLEETEKEVKDASWEVDRMLKAMHESDDFYMQHVAQVRLDRWSKGRVTVVGDARYAPSPLTGMGTSLAFIGAYVLAGEISKHPNNVPAALESYVCVLRPYVERIQKLPPGIPWIVNPQSTWCIKVLEIVFWGAGLLQNTLIARLFWKIGEYLPAGNGDFKLPDYEAFKQ